MGAVPSRGTCTPQPGELNCELGTLEPGETATVEVSLRPDIDSTLSTDASVDADQPDPEPANDAASEQTAVGPVDSIAHQVPAGGTIRTGTVATDEDPLATIVSSHMRHRFPSMSGPPTAALRPASSCSADRPMSTSCRVRSRNARPTDVQAARLVAASGRHRVATGAVPQRSTGARVQRAERHRVPRSMRRRQVVKRRRRRISGAGYAQRRLDVRVQDHLSAARRRHSLTRAAGPRLRSLPDGGESVLACCAAGGTVMRAGA